LVPWSCDVSPVDPVAQGTLGFRRRTFGFKDSECPGKLAQKPWQKGSSTMGEMLGKSENQVVAINGERLGIEPSNIGISPC